MNRGDCRVSADGRCIFSEISDPPTGSYNLGGTCTFFLTRDATIDSVRFNLDENDFVDIEGQQFGDTTGPSMLAVDGMVSITFTTDANPFTTDGQFEICIVM